MVLRAFPSVVIAAAVLVLISQPAAAGGNSDVRLAMHCVATNQYLYDLDECPQSCDEIDCDLTRQELAVSGGWGKIFLVAYNVDGIAGIEFALEFAPGTASMLDGPHYLTPTHAPVLGNVTTDGGIAAWGNNPCMEPETSGGGVAFAYLDVQFTGSQAVVLQWADSQFSYRFDPHNYTLDCTSSFREDPIIAHHGAVIGGDCRSILGDPCTSGPISEEATWGEVKQKYRH
ncbi:MAG: hypothetical protein KAW17_08715 [Candidatus Eisenbacteria sp.]|nr:hypothetical protein [Candidatus Eisenbacteria bacterium]